MKKYTKADTNVPMAFYYFYTYVRIPLLIIATIYQFIVNGVSNELVFLIEAAEALTFLCACIGLIKRKYWGYIVNKILIIIEFAFGILFIIIGIILLGIDEWESASSMIGASVALLIFNPLIFIYFEKRKYLFDGAPSLPNDISSIPNNETTTATTQTPVMQNPIIPEGYAIDSDMFPYKKNRVYGWGKEFNAFVTRTGQYFHRSKCPKIKGKKKILFHRYNAILRYIPCPYCKPIAYIDDWYIQAFPNSPFNLQKPSTNNYTGEQIEIKEMAEMSNVENH